eukprot:49153-Rhodomonas_salina.1
MCTPTLLYHPQVFGCCRLASSGRNHGYVSPGHRMPRACADRGVDLSLKWCKCFLAAHGFVVMPQRGRCPRPKLYSALPKATLPEFCSSPHPRPSHNLC